MRRALLAAGALLMAAFLPDGVAAQDVGLSPTLANIKRSNVVRTCLGQLLPQVHQKWAMPLVDTMKRLGITPIRPS